MVVAYINEQGNMEPFSMVPTYGILFRAFHIAWQQNQVADVLSNGNMTCCPKAPSILEHKQTPSRLLEEILRAEAWKTPVTLVPVNLTGTLASEEAFWHVVFGVPAGMARILGFLISL